jgi:hypothetical protein
MMTVLEHIKHLVVGLTTQEKLDLASYLSKAEPTDQKPHSLRGDWSNAFSNGEDPDTDLKEIRGEWQKEWRSGEFVE